MRTKIPITNTSVYPKSDKVISMNVKEAHKTI